MAGITRGITIEFRGETTKLDSALRNINKSTRDLDSQIKAVDRALKFNPTSVELWRKKQELLTQRITESKERLNLLKDAQAKMDAEGVDKNSAQYRKLQTDIINTENKVKQLEGDLKKIGQVNLRAASEQFKQLGTGLTNAGNAMRGVSAAAAALDVAIGALTAKSAKWADDVNTMSKVYGIGTRELQTYSAAADLVDVKTEDIAAATTRLKKSMLSAKDGSGATAEVFKELGVSVTDANGNLRDADDVFQEVLKSLGSMENETERDALAMKVLGKGAQALNPLIADSGETYKQVADTLKKYNLDFISQEDLDNANKFNDELDTIKTIGLVAFQNLGTQLASTLAPALEKVVEWVGKVAEWLGNLDPRIVVIIGAIAGVVAAIAPVLIVLGKVAFAISSIMNVLAVIGPAIAGAGGVIAALAGPIGIVIGVIAAVVIAFKVWKKHGDTIKKFFVDLGKKLADVWKKIKETVVKAFADIKRGIQTALEAIKTIFLTIVKAYVTIIRTEFEIMKTIVTTAINLIKQVITTVFNVIKTIITAYVTAYVTIIRTEFELAKLIVTTAVNAIKVVVTTVFNAIKSAVTTIWNGIKLAITNPVQAAKNTLTTLVNGIKNGFSFGGIVSKVQSAFASIKSAMATPIQSAWNIVKGAIDKIKGLFPLKLGKLFSGLKTPHFKLSWSSKDFGKLGTVNYPTGLGVSWYRKGGIFDSPSIIGVGEAGSEAVVPLDKFWDKLDRLAENATAGETVINVYASPGMDVNALASKIEQILVNRERQRTKAYGSI